MMNNDRRSFLKRCFGTSCGFSATLLLSPLLGRKAYGREMEGQKIGEKPFARIEKLHEGVYALISTPFTKGGKSGDLSTHSNGGLIIGKDKILAIDSYRTPAGAAYMADACLFLTGRLPTHVVNTHFHFDHLGGTRAFMRGEANPVVIMTQTTRKLAFENYSKTVPHPTHPDLSVSALNKWGGYLSDASAIITNEEKAVTLDLGGRTVTITPMKGHTASDLVITDDLSGTTFAGDLVWDGIFPNFMSSSPSQWIKSVESIVKNTKGLIVPGHGSVCKNDSASTRSYRHLLAEIEKHARASREKGISSDRAAKDFHLPESLGDYRYFRNGFHEMAMDAWYRELAQ
ncbi:MBL fold metallo-hydrolase [Verrucomicrobiaceae bacterium 5K15]|uniref:MBL fold metallo-hydrolase n=1 Tax=Oceaniferula flava TaxID=2800421 RepID=A0AAE2VE06_9BACT|nr:MBL fold metallo-hydrolase [Oceaniferula flavus]MBK1856571.1 MBL fold metallo-hydrolase [Oceaniferula flavus]MBM1137878.1 MBL fold metallo-hydrolase [Oceaniferula flavus]